MINMMAAGATIAILGYVIVIMLGSILGEPVFRAKENNDQ